MTKKHNLQTKAMELKCSFCLSEPGEWCRSGRYGASGEETRSLHAERINAARPFIKAQKVYESWGD